MNGAAARRAGRRVWLTLRYERPGAIVARVLLFPCRFSPRARRLHLSWPLIERGVRARLWHRRRRAGTAGDMLFGAGPARAQRPALAYAARARADGPGIVGPQLIDGRGVIAQAGLEHDAADPDRLVPRFARRPAGFGPAAVPGPVLAVAGEGMYVRADVIARLGPPDLSTEQGAVDYCLRAWQHGFGVAYEPAAIVAASAPAPPVALPAQGRRLLGHREVTDGEGRLRIVYVTQGTGLWGGHRVIFEDLNALAQRGHDVTLFTLEAAPDWFELRVPVRTFASYAALTRALAPMEAIKVATWWETAMPVWRASVTAGIPVYFVQDIESSYYPDGEVGAQRVLATYRSEFRYLTTSRWNRDRLAELGRPAAVIAPAVDLDLFHPPQQPRRQDMILAIGRDERLKRLDLTLDAWRALPEPRPELCLFGRRPELAPPDARYVFSPSDAEVGELMRACTVFVSSSAHEGFALPPLEAMATGAAVVCTDAHGNRDYCRDGVNCRMVEPEPAAIADAIQTLLSDRALRERLGAAGIATARDHVPKRRADALVAFLLEVARGARPRAEPRG